jgi:HAE1 family hydrophobic/amphiphilic exporter-1
MANLTETSLKRPAFITMIIVAMIVLGLFSRSKLGVDLYPNVNFPVVVVSTVYPGASPQEVETEISKQIEEVVGTIPGLDQIESTSEESVSTVVIRFKLESNLDTVAIDVQKKIDSIMNKLPKDIDKPMITKADIQALPFMTISIDSPRPGKDLYFVVKNTVKPQLERVNGVARVDLIGEEQREIQIQFKKNALRGRGLTIGQISQQLQQDNINIPAGKIEQGSLKTDLRVLGQINSLKELEQWPVRCNDGTVVPLSTIAVVRDTHVETKTIARTNGRSSIGITITKQSDASVVKVAAETREALKQIPNLPKDVKLTILADNSEYINKSLQGVNENLLEGVLFTAIILLLFLRSVPSTVIVLLAIPTSLVSTFMVLYFAGFTLNVMTLMALALTIGILVDDSIVVLENIHRHLEMGESPFEAALKGRLEIAQAAIAITLVDVVVFLPIAFMGGILGQFFKPFALTIVAATLFSLFVSFTLTPMLAYFFLKKDDHARFIGVQGIMDFWENTFQSLRKMYEKLIVWALEHKGLVIIIAVVALVYSFSLLPRGKIGAEFIAEGDEGEFSVSITMPITSTLKATDAVARDVEKRVMVLVPEAKSFFTTVGSSSGGGFSGMSSGGTNLINITAELVDLTQRKRSVTTIMADVRKKIKGIPGATIVVQAASSTEGSRSPVQVEIFGNDFAITKKIAEQVFLVVQKVPGTVDVRNSWFEGKQEAQIVIDRRKAAAYGLSVIQVANAMRSSIEGTVISRYREENKEADIRVLIAPQDKQTMADISNLPIASVQGKTILLSQVATIKRNAGPVRISRKDRQRKIVISANVLGKAAGSVNSAIRKELQTFKLPEGVTIGYGQSDKQMQQSFSDLLSSLGLSVLLVYMLMVALYESYRYPFVIMFSLPLSLVGALNALALTGRTINIFSLVGFIMLMGLVAKNGILLVDFTNRLRAEGKSIRDSLIEAGSLRLRPILMTTMAMVFGMLPLAIAVGSGAEIRSGLVTVVIGGLISSLLLTLVVIPVVYSIVEGRKERRERLRRIVDEA